MGQDAYFEHLLSITLFGRLYKRHFTSPRLYNRARSFGPKILEVGSGIGAGILGAYPRSVTGIDINRKAVEYCHIKGLDARLVDAKGGWDISDASFDACVLDNVLEHLEDPLPILRECHRVTGLHGGLVIAVPGAKGFASDPDHKIYYDDHSLPLLNHGWVCADLSGFPMLVGKNMLSKHLRQFCYVGVYRKWLDQSTAAESASVLFGKNSAKMRMRQTPAR